MWAGPLSNWVAACDLMLGMDVDTVVPGHGPVTDKAGVSAVRDYLAFVESEATRASRPASTPSTPPETIGAAMGADERFSELGESGRIAVNVETVYRALDPTHRTPDVVEQFRRMAALERRMTTRLTDVVVVGDGPAGCALAHGCARRGVDPVLVGMGLPWTATYGCWVDELEPAAGDVGSVADLFAVTMSDLAIVTDRRQILSRSYGVLDNERCATACSPTSIISGRGSSRRGVRQRSPGRVGRRFDDPGAGS